MKNREIAHLFESLANILEIQGANQFRVNAYRRVARALEELTVDVAGLVESGEITEISGIGKGTAAAISEFLETGTIEGYEEAKAKIPKGLLELLAISPGMGEKKIERIQAGIRAYESGAGRMLLGTAISLAEMVKAEMQKVPGVTEVSVAGSMRRWKETIGDVDVLVTGGSPEAAIDAFTSMPGVKEVLASGSTKASVRIEEAFQVDVRVVSKSEWGAALMYFTGSKEHNVRLRALARERGLRLNEYGLFKGDGKLSSRTERAVYRKLGMAWVPPELREDRGEVEASLEGRLPRLVEMEDIRGDLHMHSVWSDGGSTIEEVARAAKARGYEYIVVSDHSRSLRIANGLSIEKLEQQAEEIDDVNRRVRGIKVLKGTEADILSDGSVDYPDEVLERLDVVVASIHSGFQQPSDRITGRIITAMKNPHVDIIGHPTGRVIGRREAYGVDMERVMEAAAETGTALEINCHDERIDLNDVHARQAAEMGVKLSLGTDSHDVSQMWEIVIGVHTARRGWLGPESLLNTLTLEALLSVFS
jgi:DNA polymerase (family 10)